MNKKLKELAKRYERKDDMIEMLEDILGEQYHVNAFNYPKYPIITTDEEIQVFNWGLIPFWTSTEEDAKEIRRMTLNARADTIFQKPSFSVPILSKRCLIPSTGYFEWRHEDGKKLPYFIYVKDEEIFSMAGVYDVWRDKQTESSLITFSMITTDANSLTAYIHNVKKRMPVILSKEDEEKWLDPDLDKIDIALLMKPFEADRMDAYRINTNFIKKPSDDPSVIEKLSKERKVENEK